MPEGSGGGAAVVGMCGVLGIPGLLAEINGPKVTEMGFAGGNL